MTIALTGSTAFDYLMKFPGYFKDHILPEHLEKISLSFLVDDMVKQRGGVAANIAYNLAMLGAKPFLISNAGQDFSEYRQALEAMGIDTSGVEISKEKFTASFFANTDLSNAQIASFYAGAMAEAANVSLLTKGLTSQDMVVISPNDPLAMVKYCHECAQMGVPFIFDPGQQIIRMSKEDLVFGVTHAYALFVNDYEFQLLIKHTGLSESELYSYPRFTVITLGARGSVIHMQNVQTYEIPVVKPVRIKDPTGVGDAFRGGFLRGYLENFDLGICGRMGSLAAAYCLEQSGTQNHFYTRQEFVNRYHEIFQDDVLLDSII